MDLSVSSLRFVILTLVLCMINTSVLSQSFDTIQWRTTASQPYTVNEAQGEVVNGKLYTFGGFDSQKSPNFTPTKRSYVYNPATNAWTPIADLPFTPNGTNYGGVTHTGITTDGTNIYFAGGYTSNADGTGQIFGTNQVWRYNVNQNTYTKLINLPYNTSAGQLEYLNGKLHLIGGTNPSRTTDLGDHLVLDLNNMEAGWNTLAPLPNPRHHGGSAIVNGLIYFIGGQHEHDGELITQKDVHVYNPASDSWTKVTDLPVPAGTNGRGHISSAVVVRDNKIIVLGGETAHGVRTNMVSVYDPQTNTWENSTPLPQSRYSGVAGNINGKIYYTGGSGTSITYEGTPALSADVHSILPSEDAYVRNGIYAADNYGSDTALLVKTYTTKADYSRAAYLKFPLSNVTNVTAAKLRIYGRNTETTTTINLSLYGVDNDAWTENGITWNTAPPAQSTPLASFGVNNQAKYVELDVTEFIKAQLNGDKVASFVIKDPANQNKIVGFGSRENSQNPPQLVITGSAVTTGSLSFTPGNLNFTVIQNGTAAKQTTTLSSSSGTPTIILTKSAASDWLILPSSAALGSLSFDINSSGLLPGNYTALVTAAANGYNSATLQVNLTVSSLKTETISSIADAYVRNGIYAADNYGSDTALLVKTYTTKADYSRAAYLKFPLSNVTDVTAAKLRIYGRNTETTTTINLSLYGVDNDAWTENGITWNTAPPAQSTPLASFGVNNQAKYVELDVTEFIKAQLNGDKVASFVIKDPANQNKIVGFGSRENSQNPPQLVITGSADTTTPSNSILFTQLSQSAEVDQGGTQSLLEFISTSDNNPVSVQLNAIDENGSIPSWLTVNGNMLNGIKYTTGSEISFTFDATNLSIGKYTAKVNASAPGYKNAVLDILLTVRAGSSGTLSNFKINFQDSLTVPPSGWYTDYGQAFGTRTSANQGTSNIYGWIKRSDKTPVDLTLNGRKRTSPSDVILATLMHMQGNNVSNFKGTPIEGIWEAQVANGDYDVTVSVGDGTETDSKHYINIEGVPAIVGFVPTTSVRFKTATISVTVADGLLTVDAIGGTNTKINSIIIQPTTTKRPSVIRVNPENSSQNVSENTSISTSILNLPNGGINNSTITTSSVYLTEEATGYLIPANVNGTGGGDAITLVPKSPLKLNTTYVFTISDGVKDLTGASFIPYSSTFTTGSVSTSEIINAKFDKVDLPTASGRHSSLTIGPDGKLYALSINGVIKRFAINEDGTLADPELIYSLQDAYGSRQQRLAIGFAFDPASSADNLIAYVTHSSYVFQNGPDWDGRLTRLSGNNLQNVQDILINLPRSAKDHLTNSINFGPDGALYFTQGSTSAMGKADKTWGYKDERLLSAAVLRLDLLKLGSLPLDVKTADGGGNYNPYTSNAPLTIYASGVRNAYDLVWHSNGELYVPTNGSAAGGNTPASVSGTLRPDGTTYNGPAIPSLSNVQQTQKDFLFKVRKGGYYGHPNPTRGEYVMNGGNPTSSIDPAQVDDYPLGTLPDVNWRGYTFDFQANKSPNGAIEYKSNTFNGALKGKIMVVRYSQNDDIITLTPGGTEHDIVSYNEGASIEGFTGFVDPLDLTEDVRTGNIYVSEYGGEGKITLLRPNTSGTNNGGVINVTPDKLIDNDVSDGTPGINRTITIKNIGNSVLSVSEITLSGTNPGEFLLGNKPSLPLSLNAQESVSFTIAFNPTSVGLKTAAVTIKSNDSSKQVTSVPLRGLGTSGTGGTNEPSLQTLFNLMEIPVTVGDDDAATSVINSNTDLQKAPLLGEEVSIQRFIKAEAGNITIEPLAVFGPTANNPIVGLGWYKSGDVNSKQELFTVSNNPTSNGQTVNVNYSGVLSFDPENSSFGFYSNWPFFNNRHLYSEDMLNTFSGSIPHHIRVYPYKDKNGVVPFTYIIAFEENTSGFDYQDLLFIVKNVRSAEGTIDVNVAPVADALIRNGSYANTNYGTDTSLIVKSYATSTGYTRASYLKFPLNRVSDVISAKLRVYGRNIDNTASINLHAYGVDNDMWAENSITWNNAPAPSTASLGSVSVNNVAKYYEIDVTEYVKTQFTTDKQVSLFIQDPFNINKTLSFNSKEHALNPPQLVITTTSVVPPSNSSLFVENLDKFPSNDHFVASRVNVPWSRDGITYNANHDTARIRIHNKGINNLVVNNLLLSNKANWKFLKLKGVQYDSSKAFPFSVSPGTYADLTLQFIAVDPAPRIKQFVDNLTIVSNDDQEPNKTLYLHGLYQEEGESFHEPYAQDIINAFGFKTRVGFYGKDPDMGAASKPKGDEVLSSYFLRADPNKPVYMIQMAAYHGCCTQSEAIEWYAKGTTTLNKVFTHIAIDAQSLLPRKGRPASPAEGTFNPSGAFGLKVGGKDWSDTLKNPSRKIGVRVWKAIDANGKLIPNTYIMANDYLGTEFTNYDYNDNVYYVTNIKPEVGSVHYSELVATPSAVEFGEKLLQSTTNFTLNLQSLGKTYPNGSSDPSLTISYIEIKGENKSEFAVTQPSKLTLDPQEATELIVSFKPNTEGLKIADLLIHYNNSPAPLRVPLYGIAKSSSTTVTLHHRIKSGSSTPVTVNGKTWNAETGLAYDNLEPFKNSLLTSIKATDDDAVYTLEQSSNGDKKPFRYEIPVANGSYVVRLHFAEIYWGAPGTGLSGGAGSRVMNVALENEQRLINLDVAAEVGTGAALVKNIPVNVTDGKLNIDFSATVNRPMICGVEVYSFRPSNILTQVTPNEMVSLQQVEDSLNNFEKPKVYPNPLKQKFKIQFPTTYKGNITLQIGDLMGRTFELGKYSLKAGGSIMDVNISKLNLKQGIYFLKILSDERKTEIIKLLIE